MKRGSTSSVPTTKPTPPPAPIVSPTKKEESEEEVIEEPITTIEEVDEEPPIEIEVIEEESKPLPQTIEVGAEIAFRETESREAELRSLIRDFLVIGEQTPEDIAAFIEDLTPRGFDVSHNIVNEYILNMIQEMAERREKEHEAQSLLPGSWRERQSIRRFEEERTGLLDSLEEVLMTSRGDIPGARMAFEKKLWFKSRNNNT